MTRLFDVLTSSLFLALLSPFFIYRSVTAKLTAKPVFSSQAKLGLGGRPFRQWSFAGDGMGKNWPILFNIMAGDLAWGGVRPLTPEESEQVPAESLAEHTSFRPGVVSPYGIRKNVGLAYDEEFVTDHDFFSHASFKQYLGLCIRAVIGRLLDGSKPRIAPSILHFWGVDITNTSMNEALDWIDGRIKMRQRSLLFFVNPACLNTASENEEYRNILKTADRILADGIGIKIGSRLLKQDLVANVNGTDLFPRLCERAGEKGYRLFLLGGQPGVAEKAGLAMQERYPGLVLAGFQDGFFEPDQETDLIETINRSGAEVLLVGFGVPKQELWLARLRDKLSPYVCMGVGGLFDYYSGRIPRAPVWLREIGLEWLWRLLQEPQRMWQRYLVGNPLFVYRVIQQRQQGWEMQEDLLRHELLSRYSRLPYMQRRIPSRMLVRRFLWRFMVDSSYLLKRLLDIIASVILLALLFPLFLVIMVVIYLNSPGPVFFKQTRVGRWGKLFTMWKFRSMYLDADQRLQDIMNQNEMTGGVIFKMKNDPRIFPFGRFIRKASIDELPQLWNVLIGDMSLVGPRPALPKEVNQYSLDDRRRLDVIPGITCIWQVSGRSNIPFPQQVQLDVQYIESHSIGLDIKLLLQTIPAVLFSRGAY